MKKNNILILGLSIFVLLNSSLSMAEEKQQEKPFQVEMIVFENNAPIKTEEQTGLKRLGALNLKQAIQVDQDLIRPEQWQLKTLHEKLVKNQHYRILYHHAWQACLKDRKTFHLMSDQISEALGQREFEGTIIAQQKRHKIKLSADLIFKKNRQESNQATLLDKAVKLNEPEVFHLQASRMISEKEVHYFDHPRFGAIVLVDRLN